MNRVEEIRAAMRSAQVAGKGQYFEPGRYELEVEKAFYKRTIVDGTAKENIIFEFKVLASSNPACEVGATRSTVFSFKHAGWMGRLKALLVACAGGDPDAQLTNEQQDEVADIYGAILDDSFRVSKQLPPDFLKGIRLRAEAIPGVAKSGQAVTNMKWAAAPQE